jgi:hypothetical protein
MVSGNTDAFLKLILFTLEFEVSDSNVSYFLEHPFLWSDFSKFLKILENSLDNGFIFFDSFFAETD